MGAIVASPSSVRSDQLRCDSTSVSVALLSPTQRPSGCVCGGGGAVCKPTQAVLAFPLRVVIVPNGPALFLRLVLKRGGRSAAQQSFMRLFSPASMNEFCFTCSVDATKKNSRITRITCRLIGEIWSHTSPDWMARRQSLSVCKLELASGLFVSKEHSLSGFILQGEEKKKRKHCCRSEPLPARRVVSR